MSKCDSCASITGKIISMSLALGDIARLRTRALYADIHSRSSWQGTITLTADAKEELNFWLGSIDEFNSRHVWRAPSAVRVVYSDASSTGFGSYVVQHGEHIAHRQWSLQETQKSSTWRELRAVSHTLKVFAGMLSNHRVRWFTDNQNVAHIIQVGSKTMSYRQKHLQFLRQPFSII